MEIHEALVYTKEAFGDGDEPDISIRVQFTLTNSDVLEIWYNDMTGEFTWTYDEGEHLGLEDLVQKVFAYAEEHDLDVEEAEAI